MQSTAVMMSGVLPVAQASLSGSKTVRGSSTASALPPPTAARPAADAAAELALAALTMSKARVVASFSSLPFRASLLAAMVSRAVSTNTALPLLRLESELRECTNVAAVDVDERFELECRLVEGAAVLLHAIVDAAVRG